jgi:hypothetical protein
MSFAQSKLTFRKGKIIAPLNTGFKWEKAPLYALSMHTIHENMAYFTTTFYLHILNLFL